ncbi:MAG TPA: RraA family protein [Vicinamibacterales bacterium]|nr:RraA family protein [Vicinamibacterales bacterium]
MSSTTPDDKPPLDPAVVRASKLDTTSLSDALDRLGIAGQCLNIKPLDHTFQLTGRAFTILYGPAGVPPGTVGDYIDDVAPGSVVVLDNGGRENATVWGDILTWVAHRRGVAGTVIDGACRDTHMSRTLGYPIYSRSYSMRTGKDRVQVEAMNGPVNIGDARVQAGDILRGDADGVLVIPRAHEEAVLVAAEEIDAIEQRIRAAINDGQTLAEARKALGYHQLQARRRP